MKADREDLRPLLDAVRRRWRAEAVLRCAGRAALAGAIPLAAAALVSRVVDLGDGALLLLVAVTVLAALGAVIVIASRLPRRPDDTQLARFVEERASALADVEPFDDLLVSAVAENTASDAPAFRAHVVDLARRRLEAVGATRIITPDAVRRAALEGLGGVAAVGLATVLVWPALARATEAGWISLFPESITVEVLPGDTRVPAGKPLTIRASVRAGRSLLTRFTPRLTVSAAGDERGVVMTRDGEGFQFSFESVDRTFDYRVTAGSAQSAPYKVTALFPPRVERIDVRYEFPSFTKLPARTETDGGDIYAPAGTKVQVRIHTDKPVQGGQMVFGRDPAVSKSASGAAVQNAGQGSKPASNSQSELKTADARTLEGELTLAADNSYRVRLRDADGLQSSGETEYFIRIMDDRPPDVRILRPEGDQQVTPLEEVAVEARAEDDYGIDRFELVYAVAGREPNVIPLGGPGKGGVAQRGSHVIAIEDLRVQPGDVITYYARARDIGRGKRSTETRSDMFFLEVRPFTEEFVNAQSQSMAGMAGDQIDSLIAAQKEIINATWNIERRAASGAGRSRDDVTAIAAAQAELKARVEQMSAPGGRSRGPFRAPQQIGFQRPQRGRLPGDPVGTAISAMGKAVDQLQGQRTADALPHEMAALQGLLQAQAEIRRREVAQQAGASFGGMGRQGQDLSALFDKELQRQQRTNYESRSQADTRPDRDESKTSALDRIRDLARRQEELGRQQRELANQSMSPDEVKRRLERLTREQEALREQTEQLSKQMGQPNGQPQRGATNNTQQSQGGSGEMRDAADEMRGAASELQRQAPASAAERSERAAAQLRRLEQQLRNDSPEARDRAAGELRLEAQQIAEEQRRIAGEAERLDKSGGTADGDAWRRLAGEKDKLADRVDELRRSSEQLGNAAQKDQKDGHGAARSTASAARDLADQRIADRMRETAREMRDGSGNTGTETVDSARGRSPKPAPRPRAGAEQQLARALDQVADKLRADATADAERLSGQLDEARGIRERLDRLEQRLREAEAKAAGREGGRQDRSGTSPGGAGNGLQELRAEYAKEVQRARQELARLERSAPGAGLGGATPEEHEWSVTDQGTEAFKQDFSKWESLRKDVDSGLERYEASVVAAAARKSLQDRLSAGGSDRVPDAYRRLIARYYESLARKK